MPPDFAVPQKFVLKIYNTFVLTRHKSMSAEFVHLFSVDIDLRFHQKL